MLFKEAAKSYNIALQDNSHTKELKFTTPEMLRDRTSYDPKELHHDGSKKKTGKRHVTWFNPSFIKNVASNVEHKFLPFYLHVSHQMISSTRSPTRKR